MFTGIIKSLGKIKEITGNGSNKSFMIQSDISPEFRIDESVSHDGVCLTVEDVKDGVHKVTAIKETLDITSLYKWKVGDFVNLEQSMQMNSRLDGHIVQGHVDTTATCIKKKELKGSYEFTFRLKKKNKGLIIEKGSISVNGVSLTAFNVKKKKFSVAIIPFTLKHTNFFTLNEGAIVNIEFDVLGKYLKSALKIK